MGQHGVAFPVGKVVYILDADDSVVEGEDNIVDGDGTGNTIDDIKSGSGDLGLALFRRGKTYTITASEDTILTAAGYTTT